MGIRSNNIKCKHNSNGLCLVLSKVRGRNVFVDKNYCKKCITPPVLQQLKNAANATGQAIKSGFKTVSKEEQEKRFEICEQCEFLTDKILKRCSKCGCCMKLKKKLEAWHCPIDRW